MEGVVALIVLGLIGLGVVACVWKSISSGSQALERPIEKKGEK